MVFVKGDPKTKAAAKKGGRSGTKHFASVSKRKLKSISKSGGIARQEQARADRRAKMDRKSRKPGDKIMRSYIDFD